MNVSTQEIALAEGEPFHAQTAIETQASTQPFESTSIPAQRPGPYSEATRRTSPNTNSEVRVRSRSLSECAAESADELTRQIGSLTTKLEDANRLLAEPMDIADLLNDSGSQRAVTLTLRRTGPEKLGQLNRELKAAERLAGRRIGATSLNSATQTKE